MDIIAHRVMSQMLEKADEETLRAYAQQFGVFLLMYRRACLGRRIPGAMQELYERKNDPNLSETERGQAAVMWEAHDLCNCFALWILPYE
jgi:hypothetical protein